MHEYTIQILAQRRGYAERFTDWKDYWQDIIRRVNEKVKRSGIDDLSFKVNHLQEFEDVNFDSVGSDVQSNFRIILEVAEDQKHLKAWAYYLGEGSDKTTDRIAMLHYSSTPEQISSLVLHEIGHAFGCGFPELYNQRTSYQSTYFESAWVGDCMDYVNDDEGYNELHKLTIMKNTDQSKPATWLKDAVVGKYPVVLVGTADGKQVYEKREPTPYNNAPVPRFINATGYQQGLVFISLPEVYYSYLKGLPEHRISVELKKKKEQSASYELSLPPVSSIAEEIEEKEVISMSKLSEDFGVRALIAVLIIAPVSIAVSLALAFLVYIGDVTNAIELSRPVMSIVLMVVAFYFATRATQVGATTAIANIENGAAGGSVK